MATVSSSNTFSVAAHSTNGMSGLISGMDTDGMVQQMLAGTQNKIDKQEALKQQLTWKQEIYRNIIKDINNFGNKFFSFDATTKLTSTDFFDQMISTTTSTAFKVSGNADAATGITSVLVKQLAANAKATTTGQASKNALTGKMDTSLANQQRLVLNVGSSEVEVDLSQVAREADGTITQENMIKYLNDHLSGLKAEASEDGSLTLTSASGQEIQVSGKSDAYALHMLGLNAYSSGATTTIDGKEAKVLGGKLSLDGKMDFQITVDGVSNMVEVNVQDLIGGNLTDLNEQLKNLYGTLNNGNTPMVQAKIEDGNIQFVIAGGDKKASGHQVQFRGDDFASGMLGISNGQSSRISTTVALKEANLSTPLYGDEFKFNINGVDFSFTKDDTIYTVMRTINNSGAGVRMTYSALSDQFSIESTTAGSGDKIRMSQSQGNLLTAIFGRTASGDVNIEAADTAVSSVAGTGDLTGDAPSKDLEDTEDGIFTMYVNGSKVQVRVSDAESTNDILKQINKSLQQRFGYVDGDPAGDAKSRKQAIELSLDGDGKIVVHTRNNAAVSFDAAGTDNKKDLSVLMGLAGKDNFISDDAMDTGAYAELKAAGVTLLKDADGNSTGRLAIGTGFDASKITDPEAQKLFKQLFGVDAADVQLGTGKAADTDTFIQEGHNAVVEINGVETERSSNNFTIDGLNYELKTVTAGYEDAVQGADGIWRDKDGNAITVRAETVTTERNIDGIVDGLKSFVEDYNKLVLSLNEKLQEDANYRKYAPLTSAQKKEMSDREVELWEEKAKEGLIRNDNDISIMLTSLRQALYQKPAGSKYALYDFGIETVSGLADKAIQGTLTIDETKLRQMITTDPESLRQLFTDSADGLAAKMKTAIDKAAKTSSGSPGTLVQLAGVSGYGTDKNNTITNQINSINEKLKQLNSQYEKERTRYWNQFNQMEQLIQQMNSQSTWLGNMFAS